ncbi:recombinase [Cytobacillus sp. Bac17]|nr:recombinase [Cytobacillus sp. Bac17]
MGINTELQVGDIVKLKVGDVKGKNYFYILEGKTTKNRK